jgi:hypothetical protein
MKKEYVTELITNIVKDKPTAEMIVDRLMEEDLLNLGYGNSDIDAVVIQFSETFGNTKTSKYDRFAAKRLTEKYGRDSIVGIIQLLGKRKGEKYCPVVGNISQLEEKIVSVMNFLRKGVDNQDLDI